MSRNLGAETLTSNFCGTVLVIAMTGAFSVPLILHINSHMCTGTGNVDPRMMMSHKGMDRQFSKNVGNFHGPAHYFAYEMPYSLDSYAYRSIDREGRIQSDTGEFYHLALCHVILGNSLDKTNLCNGKRWHIQAVKPIPGIELQDVDIKKKLLDAFQRNPHHHTFDVSSAPEVSGNVYVEISPEMIPSSSSGNASSLYLVPDPFKQKLRVDKQADFSTMITELGTEFDSLVSGPHQPKYGGIGPPEQGPCSNIVCVYDNSSVYVSYIVTLKKTSTPSSST